MSADEQLVVLSQALRKSHCAHKNADDKTHTCVGACTISPRGVDLDCSLCGKGEQPLVFDSAATQHAARIFQAAGIQWSALSGEAQRAAMAEIGHPLCERCRTSMRYL